MKLWKRGKRKKRRGDPTKVFIFNLLFMVLWFHCLHSYNGNARQFWQEQLWCSLYEIQTDFHLVLVCSEMKTIPCLADNYPSIPISYFDNNGIHLISLVFSISLFLLFYLPTNKLWWKEIPPLHSKKENTTTPPTLTRQLAPCFLVLICSKLSGYHDLGLDPSLGFTWHCYGLFSLNLGHFSLPMLAFSLITQNATSVSNLWVMV